MGTGLISENDNLNNDIIQWGWQELSSLGYTLNSKLPENVQNTPWSYVLRFDTSVGYIYLKHMPDKIALEATITQILHDQFHAPVPTVIAHNTKLNCFLMKDAGKPLRGILKQKFETTLLCKAIEQFTSIQMAVADHIDIFLDVGVPDWRLDKLPNLYMQLLSQKDILLADGLSVSEISMLENLLPKVSTLCEKLFSYSIKQTLVQCDFHDNNILIEDKSQTITFIDLGEIVISHPFFSLVGCLRQAKRHHALSEINDRYQRLLEACFKNYLTIESKQHLSDAFTLAQLLWYVYEVLGQYRLMRACGKDKIMTFQHGKLSGSLKEFIMLV